MIESKALGRFLMLGLGVGATLWALGAAFQLAAGVVGVVVSFGTSLALGLAVVDGVRQRGRGLSLRLLAFWAVCLSAAVLSVWSLAAISDPTDSVRLRSGALASAIGGLVLGAFMAVCDP